MKYVYRQVHCPTLHNINTSPQVINVASCVIDYARENPEELLSVYLLRGVLDKTPGHEVRLVCW